MEHCIYGSQRGQTTAPGVSPAAAPPQEHLVRSIQRLERVYDDLFLQAVKLSEIVDRLYGPRPAEKSSEPGPSPAGRLPQLDEVSSHLERVASFIRGSVDLLDDL